MVMASDLERAYDVLSAKAASLSKYFQYYDGDQPLLYMAKRLEEIFKGLDAVFVENWCAVVIDSVKDRINLREIGVPEAMQEAWEAIWLDNELELESDDVHEAALVGGESFVVCWPDADGFPQAFYNDPRLCHVWYNAENPRVKEWAAKWWVEDDETLRMTLYYPDRLEYYMTRQKQESVNSAAAFVQAAETAVNPFGEVPVFHFKPASRRMTKSDLKNVVPIQNGINKLLTDMMVAAEYGAFKQRYVISNADTLGKLKNAPNEVWDIPAGDGIGQQTAVGEFGVTPLENYLKAINDLSMAISTITRTPKHYFFSIGSNLSGESLIAMEAPLNKKAQDRIDRFYPVWQDVTRFLLKIGGMDVSSAEVTPEFDRPAMMQPFTEAQTVQMFTSATVPLEFAAKRVGWRQAEIDEMMAARERAKAQAQTDLANGLLDSLRGFDSGNTEQ